MNAHEKLMELLSRGERSPQEWKDWEEHMRIILARAVKECRED